MKHSKNSIAVPPGATIREQLRYRKMTQKVFAIRMDLTEKHISRLINGIVELTPDVANRLEDVLGIPTSYWNGLEANYRSELARVNTEIDNEEELEISNKFPYEEASANGWLPVTNDAVVRLTNLKKFFGVVKLKSLEKLNHLDNDQPVDYSELLFKQHESNESFQKENSSV
ncbi:helix-turn-helix transcriptional regulator [Companilactobacillus mishanensis]|nr:helix-turn-helix domain-containing protein [Companilactobacillus mishanensis]